MTEPLILRTERLELREFTLDDAAFILQLINDPDWHRNIADPGVRDLDAARAWIVSRLVDRYRAQGYGLWAVQSRGNGELLGMCGFVRRDSLPEVDVGYALMPAARGKGHALEAVQACLRHGREVLGFRRVLAITSPDNVASQAVLLKAGFRFEDRRVLAGATAESSVYAWDAP
jgi:[ribosomal protein S5]-alanine N-acetyltransferase